MHPEARRGIDLYNQGKFFEAHEVLEAAWMKTGEPERDLYQGILQIGLAYYQISRGSYRGAIKMFIRGQRTLKPLGKALLGVDLVRLREQARIVENSLRDLGPDRLEELDPGLIKPVPWIE